MEEPTTSDHSDEESPTVPQEESTSILQHVQPGTDPMSVMMSGPGQPQGPVASAPVGGASVVAAAPQPHAVTAMPQLSTALQRAVRWSSMIVLYTCTCTYIHTCILLQIDLSNT